MGNGCPHDISCLFRDVSPEEAKALLRAIVSEGVNEALKKIGLGEESAEKDIKDLRALLTDWRAITSGTKETANIIVKSIWSGAARVCGFVILGFILWKMGLADPSVIKKMMPYN